MEEIKKWQDKLHITFRINNKCNLSCEYCHWNHLNHYEYNDIINTIDNIFKLQKITQKEIILYFHGGEPSFHPDIINILKYIKRKNKDKKIKIEFQTNLSLDLKLYKNIIKYINNLSVTIHYKYLQEKKLLNQFLNNVYSINNLKKFNNFDIMLENIDENELNEFYDLIQKLLNDLNYQNSEMIYQMCYYKLPKNIYESHLKFYKEFNKTENKYFWKGCQETPKATNELFLSANYKDCYCMAGNNFLVIEGNGKVFRCGIHMTNYISRNIKDMPEITNINQNLKYLINYINKPYNKCQWNFCGGDFYIPKWRESDGINKNTKNKFK